MARTRPLRMHVDHASSEAAPDRAPPAEGGAPPATSPGMPVADQVRLAALLLEQHYGAAASEVAVRGIYQCIDLGDLPGADAWRELLIAIEAAMPTHHPTPGELH